jgi:hypothetical protein
MSFWRRIFAISPDETSFTRRGFLAAEAGVKQRLEQIGQTFIHGYHSALEEADAQAVALRLGAIEPELRGFAFEGAAMALALMDLLTPWRRSRFQTFLHGPASPHAYMVHVGVGWALARLRRRVQRPLQQLDPLMRWLAVDGYGFHEGYFHWPRYVQARARPERLGGYALRVFDQGLGRSLWFVRGANVARIARTIAAFPAQRHADLWSGVGLACAYAGGVAEQSLKTLRECSGQYRPQVAQGVAFAAEARRLAENHAAHTELACNVLCGGSGNAAASITLAARVDLPTDGPEPAYEVWRQRIQRRFHES